MTGAGLICEECRKNEAIDRFIISWNTEGNPNEVKWLCWGCLADLDWKDVKETPDAISE